MSAKDVEDGIDAYAARFFGATGTGGKARQQDRDWQGAMLDQAKAQTAAAEEQAIALRAIADALGQAQH